MAQQNPGHGPGHGWSGRPSRSGSDTPRSSDVIQHGGKVDPDALRRRLQPPPAVPTDDDDGAPVVALPPDPDQQIPPTADDDAPNRVVFVLQRDLDKRLDKYLTDRISFMSRTQLQRLIDEGGVTINARKCKASTKLRAGDKVEVFVPPPPPTDIQPEDIPLDVLYEDEHLIVINKSSDIIVHPARAHNKGTMINALAFHFQHRSPSHLRGGGLSGVGKEFARPGVVHRLDRQTSGLIVFAKSDEAHWRLGTQFERRTVDKRYLAIVHGLYEPPIDTIDLPLGPHPSKEKGYREKYVVRHDVLGKPSLTIARVRGLYSPLISRPLPLQRERVAERSEAGRGSALPAAPGWKSTPPPPNSNAPPPPQPAGFSLVELELKTGRTHQIRVHLTHRGYPIVGDDMYGGRDIVWDEARSSIDEIDRTPGTESRPTLISRVALHAATISFKHPADGRDMAFTAPLPADFSATLAALARMDKLSKPQSPPGSTVRLGDET